MSVWDVVEEVVKSGAKRSINSAQGSSEPVPFRLSKMWHVNVCVLKIGDEDQVVINNQVGDEVEIEVGTKSKVIDEPSHYRDCGTKTNIADYNLPIFLWLE